MKANISLVVGLLGCGVCFAQAESAGQMFYGSMGTTSLGVTISFVARLEPAQPEFGSYSMGISVPAKGDAGMRRYLCDQKKHEVLGYDLHVETADAGAGTYRVTFSALSLTPEELKLPDASSWRVLPPPVFPLPQVVGIGDTMVMDVVVNAKTNQKIVDYIELKRENCAGAESKVGCLRGLLHASKRELTDKVALILSKGNEGTATAVRQSQQVWENYRDSACGGLASEEKRLECEVALTRSRAHDLGTMY